MTRRDDPARAAQDPALGRGTEPAAPGSSESAHPAARLGKGSRLILARHGQTDHNVAGRMQGQIDIPLNDLGIRQADALARSLERAGAPDVIISSPLRRAHATALAVAERLRLPVEVDAAFTERGFGRWEGMTGEEIREQFPAEHDDWIHRRSVHGIGMEHREEVARRVGDGCRRVLAAHPGKAVLVVAHGAAITLGISDLIGTDPETFRGISGLENCHRSALDPLLADPEGRLMRLVSHNVHPDFAP